MKARTDSYVMTADAMSVNDMAQIEIVRKTVRASNRIAKQIYKYAARTAKHLGNPMPKEPKIYRVRLMGRGPRKAAYQENLASGGQRVWSGYACYLPQKYATSFDVYIN